MEEDKLIANLRGFAIHHPHISPAPMAAADEIESLRARVTAFVKRNEHHEQEIMGMAVSLQDCSTDEKDARMKVKFLEERIEKAISIWDGPTRSILVADQMAKILRGED